MVKICSDPYPSNSKYESYFELYSFPLSDFQKYAIEAIVDGNHVLVTAHTGSGKTLPAEFAIQHFVRSGKKVIYTSPIKALSNQKYYEFTRKYPDISFGLMTGDIKTNPDADVLIMTTEILMNALFSMGEKKGSSGLSFQIDIQSELECVVFDEVHYINDADRGQTWEKTILMLPRHIQMVMLSATIDAPERFAKWCERDDLDGKIVYLSSTNKRVVPLSHYGYLVCTEGFIKAQKDKTVEKQIRDSTKQLILLQNDKGEFQEAGYKILKNATELFDKKQLSVKRKHVLNDLALFLRDREMLPAIGFVFSRRLVEMCAQEITVPLLEDDIKVGYTVRRECEQIIRKFPNFQEYLDLPEYNFVVGLLEKGIGVHHSGMIPVLREIVELMIAKKYIKLLFATESFAIGLDCPIKTAVFIGLSKFDGRSERYLMSHEYTQMAGRAGRRGIDTIGHVVHCNNLFPLLSQTDYRAMLGGKPQELVSKFRISYPLILNLIKRGQTTMEQFIEFVNNSMIFQELSEAIDAQKNAIKCVDAKYKDAETAINSMKTPLSICEKYLDAEISLKTAVNKKRKDFERVITDLAFEHRFIKSDADLLKTHRDIKREYESEYAYLCTLNQFIGTEVGKIVDVLLETGFLQLTELSEYCLSEKGKIASGIAEIHPLIIAQAFNTWSGFEDFSTDQMIGLLAIFTDVKIDEDSKAWQARSDDAFLNAKLTILANWYNVYDELEQKRSMKTGINYESALNYDMPDIIVEWIRCENEEECKWFVQTRLSEKGISIGDFVKAVMKISVIAKELSIVSEEMGNVELLYKLSMIDGKILKYVTTSQSLYI
jgi:superfamily II RNA helicase